MGFCENAATDRQKDARNRNNFLIFIYFLMVIITGPSRPEL